MRKGIISILLSILVFTLCLPGCASRAEEVQNTEQVLMYGTTAEFLTNATIRYPIRTETLRYTIYDICAIVTESVSDDVNIVIPSTVEGVPVIGIASYAFQNNKTVQRVQIGANVIEIGNYAFAGCSSLTSVQMSGSVQSIGAGAFSGCSALKSFIVPASIDYVRESTFSGCSSMTKFIIESRSSSSKDSIKNKVGERTIESNAFSGCDSLIAIWIPDDVIGIKGSAFTSDKTVIYGAEKSAAAVYAATNLMDFTVTDREDFDAEVRVYNPVDDDVFITQPGTEINCDRFLITLDKVERLSSIGGINAAEGESLMRIVITVSNNTSYERYFEGMKTTFYSWARGRDGIVKTYQKRPLLLKAETCGYPFPACLMKARETVTFAYVIRVNDKSNCVSIGFEGAEEIIYLTALHTLKSGRFQ